MSSNTQNYFDKYQKKENNHLNSNTKKINIESFKYEINKSFTRIILYDYYLKIFLSKGFESTNLLDNHPLVSKFMLKFSNDYSFLKENKKKSLISLNNKFKNLDNIDDIDAIVYKDNIPLDISLNNFLYLKILKFHTGLMQFFDIYEKYKFNEIKIDNILMNDFLYKKFMDCLDNKKALIANDIKNYTDHQIISTLCVKERLTLYNFLINEMKMKRGDVRNYINNLYKKNFRRNFVDKNNEEINELIKPYGKSY